MNNINGVKGECPVVGVLEFDGDKIARATTTTGRN